MTKSPSDHIPHLLAPNCNAITEKCGSNFVLSFRFLPRDQANALAKIYALFRIADDCVDEPSLPQAKQRALDHWRAEVTQMLEGNPKHPVTHEIANVIQKFAIPPEYIIGLFDGCQMDITKSRYQTYGELKDYCYHVAGLVGLTCVKIFGYQSPMASDMAVDLGLAFQLTNIMRDIREDLTMNRIYLPVEDMATHGYTESELRGLVDNEAFQALMRTFYLRALGCYQRAFAEFEKDTKNQLVAARIMAKTYFAILQKMERKNFPVLRKRVSLSAIEKAKLLLPVLLSPKGNMTINTSTAKVPDLS